MPSKKPAGKAKPAPLELPSPPAEVLQPGLGYYMDTLRDKQLRGDNPAEAQRVTDNTLVCALTLEFRTAADASRAAASRADEALARPDVLERIQNAVAKVLAGVRDCSCVEATVRD